MSGLFNCRNSISGLERIRILAAEKKVKRPGMYQKLVIRSIECKYSVREKQNIITVMLIITAILAMIDINI